MRAFCIVYVCDCFQNIGLDERNNGFPSLHGTQTRSSSMNSFMRSGTLFAANFTTYLKTSRPGFRVASVAFLVGFVLSTVHIFHQMFSISPADFFNFQVWRLVTSPFVETNLIILCWSILSLYQASVIIEPISGHLELLKIAGIAQVLSPLIISCFAIICYATSSSVDIYYYTYINGFAATNGAILVAIKQFLPDTIVLTTPFGRLKNTNLPLCSLLACTVLSICRITRAVLPLQIAIGVQAAWVYLRFYQYHADENLHGDSSEHFAWHTLFPRRLQLGAKITGNLFYRVCVAVRLCTPVRHIDLNQMQAVNVVLTGTGFETTETTRDAERRRQKALRDLNERLSKMRSTSSAKSREDDMPFMESIDEDVVVMPTDAMLRRPLPQSRRI
ncbi:hypothetical protein L596_005252 [Steinernema carpocapsae]|uniref:Transmembrane protein 115 n=1 Tax=Steinernema carpocapsae TaxID=34508 RepID=A0A4U8UZW1_STECR|nr:hypothetical protein L596_005252 [Steinernema carpocapsae]